MNRHSANRAVRAQRRRGRLMPAGVPRWIRVYDNGGKTGDRYTCCYTGLKRKRVPGYASQHDYRAMSGSPFHAQGIGIYGSTENQACDVNRHGFAPALGRKCHLGRRIRFQDLPDDCRKLVLQDYQELWGLK